MREYIFTETERKAIMQFMKEKERSDAIDLLAHRVQRNWGVLCLDVKLLLQLRRMINAGY